MLLGHIIGMLEYWGPETRVETPSDSATIHETINHFFVFIQWMAVSNGAYTISVARCLLSIKLWKLASSKVAPLLG